MVAIHENDMPALRDGVITQAQTLLARNVRDLPVRHVLPQFTAVPCCNGRRAWLHHRCSTLHINVTCDKVITPTTRRCLTNPYSNKKLPSAPFSAVRHISDDAETPATIMKVGLSARATEEHDKTTNTKVLNVCMMTAGCLDTKSKNQREVHSTTAARADEESLRDQQSEFT
jgi:hypothetical protein